MSELDLVEEMVHLCSINRPERMWIEHLNPPTPVSIALVTKGEDAWLCKGGYGVKGDWLVTDDSGGSRFLHHSQLLRMFRSGADFRYVSAFYSQVELSVDKEVVYPAPLEGRCDE